MSKNYGLKDKPTSPSTSTPCSASRFISASLCANCANQNGCGLLAQTTSPVHQCELYECGALSRPELVGGGKKVEAKEEPEPTSVHLLGLCLNCDKRTACKLPKPQGGVWHCEEYI